MFYIVAIGDLVVCRIVHIKMIDLVLSRKRKQNLYFSKDENIEYFTRMAVSS